MADICHYAFILIKKEEEWSTMPACALFQKVSVEGTYSSKICV